MPKILFVDDDFEFTNMLSTFISMEGYEADSSNSPKKALNLIKDNDFDFIITDIRMPEMDGLRFLEEALKIKPELTIIVMSAYGTYETAIEAVKRGAYDYIAKPFNPEELLLLLKKAEERENLKKENSLLKMQIRKESGLDSIIGNSSAIQEVKEKIKKAAMVDVTVVIQGESGTGKELVARAIHSLSRRSDKPMVTINCAAIPENLIESELFGHSRGSFTDAHSDKPGLFEEANGSTIFLDEIGELPLALQTKLLRAIETKEIRRIGENRDRRVDVRIIAATSRNLPEDVKSGRFREDLFYRLNVFSIFIPPLRNRRDDIPVLLRYFAEKFSLKHNRKIPVISKELINHLSKQSWDGNIRQLENAVESAIIMCDSENLEISHFPQITNHNLNEFDINIQGEDKSLASAVARFEKQFIIKVLQSVGGNRTKAAKMMNISHRTLLYKLKEYGIK
ncbi:MAG: sigma-54 dependent transcriptional regulator [Deltaproteobacteria bacterium]|nr:sigma-54 dependent transcriptional regulator [Deltaproteobacteria bacterium]